MADTISVRTDRLAELEDFLTALDEWGVIDPDKRLEQITCFLNSPVGLTQYLDRCVSQVAGRA